MKLYICVLDEFPDHMVPTLVAHSVLGAHLHFDILYKDFDGMFDENPFKAYKDWLTKSFRKVVVRVNQKEFDKIAALSDVYLGHENNTLEGRKSCAVVWPVPNEELPNVLKFAKLWKPKENIWLKEILSAADEVNEERLAWAISMARNEV